MKESKRNRYKIMNRVRKSRAALFLGTSAVAFTAAELFSFGLSGVSEEAFVSAAPEIHAASYAAMNKKDGTVYLEQAAGKEAEAGNAADLLMLMTTLERGLNPEGSLIFGDVALGRLSDSDPVLEPKVASGEEFPMPDAIKALLGGQATEFRYQFSEGYAPSQEAALLGMIGEKTESLSLSQTKVNSLNLSEDQACLSSAGDLMTVMINAVGNYPVLESALKVPASHSATTVESVTHNWSEEDLLTKEEIEGLEYAFVLREGKTVIGQISIATRGDVQIVTAALGTSEEHLKDVTEVLFDEAYLKAYEPLFSESEEKYSEENGSDAGTAVTFSEETEVRTYPSLSSDAAGKVGPKSVLTYAGAVGDWKRLKTLSGEYVYTKASTFASDGAVTDLLPSEAESESAPVETETQEEIKETESESAAEQTPNPLEEIRKDQEQQRQEALKARMARQKRQKIFTYIAIGAIILSLAGLAYLHFR